MKEKLYSIKIDKSGRYVRFCDDCWYETDETELRIFTREQCERIKAQMKNHYVYKVTISDGEETILEDAPKIKSEPVYKNDDFEFDFGDLAM